MSDAKDVAGSLPPATCVLTTPDGTVAADAPVVQQWENGLRLNHKVHHMMAERLDKRSKWLGVPAVVLTTVVGTSIFATLDNPPSAGWQIAAGLLNLAATVLVALQTLLNYPSRARTHRELGTGYGALRRLLEQERLTGHVRHACLTEIRVRWAKLDEGALPTPKGLRDEELARIKGGQ